MTVRVHILGLTRPEDAASAAQAGADGFGVSFWPQSTSSIDAARATEIVAALPEGALTMGMFVDAVPSVVEKTLDQTGIQLALFAGSETPEYCRRFAGRYAKVIRIRAIASLEAMKDYDCPFFVLDGYPAVQTGVREIPFDLTLARRAKSFGKVVVAGGLTPDTVAAAVRTARPYAVEATSSVESSLGIKEPRKLRQFIDAAKSA